MCHQMITFVPRSYYLCSNMLENTRARFNSNYKHRQNNNSQNVFSLSCFVTSSLIDLFPYKHGVITTEEEQYLIEPLKNTSSTTSGEWNLEEAPQHVIYKMSAIPSPQEPSQEFSCGISGW